MIQFIQNRKRPIFCLLGLPALLIIGFVSSANAALQTIGTIDQASGFPNTITDSNGVTLGQCLDPFHCAAAPADLPFPNEPLSFPDNWPDEIFWYTADSMMSFASPNGGGGSALLVMAIEGAFGGGPTLPGDNILFSRIRFRADGLIPGASYTVTHPYGTINVTADAAGTVFTTDDCGMGIPGDPGGYPRILDCPIGPFLTVLNPLPPAGFIGSIGDEVTVSGSLFNTNYFKIEGPGLGLNGVHTDLFTVTGQISSAPLQSNIVLKKATYIRPRIGPAQAQVFASSLDTSVLTVSSFGGAGYPLLNSVYMNQIIKGTAPTSDFFVNVDLTPDLAGNLPRQIIVADDAPPPGPQNALSATLTDVVKILSASYDPSTSTLTVAATSSDEVTPLTLVVLEAPPTNNTLIDGALSVIIDAPIDRVTVQSSQGGMASENVILGGPGSTYFKIPDYDIPVANAGVNQTVFLNTRVDLSAAASSGIITEYLWSQIDGPPVEISNAFTSDIHFIYPDVIPPAIPQTLTFRVTLVGPGGISSAMVNVGAISVPPITGSVDRAQAKLEKNEWRISGHVNNIVAGSTITNLIVTDSFGNTADLIARAGGIPADIDGAGLFQWSTKGTPLTTNLSAGTWTVYAVTSTGTTGPSTNVNLR